MPKHSETIVILNSHKLSQLLMPTVVCTHCTGSSLLLLCRGNVKDCSMLPCSGMKYVEKNVVLKSAAGLSKYLCFSSLA